MGLPKALVVFAFAVFLAFGYWQVRMLEEQTDSASQREKTARPISKPTPPPAANETLAVHELPTNRPASPAPISVLQWKALETEDYREYLNNLRSFGCPEETVRDIVAADLVSNFAPRRKEALEERFKDFKYWKSNPKDRAAREMFEQKRREIDQEMSWAMRELLGQDYLPPTTSQTWRTAELDLLLGFLPDEKRVSVRNLLIEFAETDRNVRALADYQLRDEPLEKLKGIMEDYDRKRDMLGKLLTPAEIQQVEMTTSWVAEELRNGLVGFNPTESEFKAIFADWQDYAETTARVHSAGEIERGDLELWMRETMDARLGEERAREFWSVLKRRPL